MKFSDLSLSEPILKMLEQRKLETPTEIQSQGIPILLQGQDLIGLSQTGTGKTLAFVLPILERINPNDDNIQAIILSPTRELAQQTKQEVQMSSEFLPEIRSVAVFGGADIRQQIFALKRRPNIVIGTPGRVLDHISRHTLKLNHIKFLVLDEADEMFNMGFRNDIIEIIKQTPKDRQTLLFSATMNNEVLTISKDYMKNPVQLKVGQQNSAIQSVKQTYFLVPRDKKKKAIHSLLHELERGKTLIFCNTKAMVGGVQSYLEKMGYPVSVLHGDMPQSQRSQVMRDYKGDRVQILITTDVSARGIDVNDILHVINFDLPQNLEYYIHRIGRTGRAGKVGNSWTILNSPDQERKLKEIQKKTNSKIVLGNLQLDNISEMPVRDDFKKIGVGLPTQDDDFDDAKKDRAEYETAMRAKTYSRGGRDSKPYARRDSRPSSFSRPRRSGSSEDKQEGGERTFRSKSYSNSARPSRESYKPRRESSDDFAKTTEDGEARPVRSERKEYGSRDKGKREEYSPFKTTRTDKQRRKSFDAPAGSVEANRAFGDKVYKSFSSRSSGVKREWKGSEAHEGADKPFRERKPFGRKPFNKDGATETSFGDREPRATDTKFGDKPRSFGRKPFSRDGASFGKKPFGRKPFNKDGATESSDRPSFGRKPFSRDGAAESSDKPRSFGRKPFNKDGAKSFGRKPFNKEGSTERTYASKDAGTDKKFSDRKPRTYVRKPRPTADKE